MSISLTPEQIDLVIRRGEAAQALMDSAAFHEAVDDLSDFHLKALVACQPGDQDRQTRDYHHMMHTAVMEIAQTVQMRAQAGVALQARLEDEKILDEDAPQTDEDDE